MHLSAFVLASRIATQSIQICSKSESIGYLSLINQSVLPCFFQRTFQQSRGPQLDMNVGYFAGQLHGRLYHVHTFPTVAE